MCWSNATLFYGLWVTTASLDFAATAHKATRPPILAIDLIIKRRRSGKLEIEGQDEKTTARELPEEVWELIKLALIRIEARKAETDRLDQYRCFWCDEDDRAMLRLSSRKGGWLTDSEKDVERLWHQWEFPVCEHGSCLDSILGSGILEERTFEQLASIAELLHGYNLQLPSNRIWTRDGAPGWSDFDSLSAIALPLRSTKGSSDGFPSLSTDLEHEYGSTHSVLDLTPEALVIPANTQFRFRRLLATYPLVVGSRVNVASVSPGDNRIPIPATSTSTSASSNNVSEGINQRKAKGKDDKHKLPDLFDKAEPRWTMWNVCETCI